jgi:hypothetical protein
MSLGACGARSGLPEFSNTVEETPDAGQDAGSCMATSVAVDPNVPNLYFVLDISGSMLRDHKWDNVRQAAASLIQELGTHARFGASVFPKPMSNACDSGVEVMPLRLGDTQGMTANYFMAATAVTPNGGTPTAATLQALLPNLRGLRGLTFVILATDGGPNCNANVASCPVDQCTRNIDQINAQCTPGGSVNCCDASQPAGGCLDGDATAQAVRDLRAAGVQTYVMGIPGSAPYAPVLDQMAIAGGTARAGQPRYYAVNTPDEAALAAAFEEIAATVMRGCALRLSDAVPNPNRVNLYLDGAVVPQGPDGWSLDGQTVTLQGSTCASFQGGPPNAAPAPVLVTQGCPTVR